LDGWLREMWRKLELGDRRLALNQAGRRKNTPRPAAILLLLSYPRAKLPRKQLNVRIK
jgi:hypothetical protein